jgi:nucleotide-binding universal stress UspA family protein
MQRIVVGVDNSDGAWRALTWAIDEAKVRHARLEVVHVWHYPYVPSAPYSPVPPIPNETLESDARAVLDRILASVDTSGLDEPIERVLVCDGDAAGLLAAAKDADLLVVGSRGRGGFAGLLLGSVSQAVSHHAPCPVVIVPAASE